MGGVALDRSREHRSSEICRTRALLHLVRTHTHTTTHTHTHTQPHTRAHARTHARTHTRTHARTHTRPIGSRGMQRWPTQPKQCERMGFLQQVRERSIRLGPTSVGNSSPIMIDGRYRVHSFAASQCQLLCAVANCRFSCMLVACHWSLLPRVSVSCPVLLVVVCPNLVRLMLLPVVC